MSWLFASLAVRPVWVAVGRVKRWDKRYLRLLALAFVAAVLIAAFLLGNQFGSPSAGSVGYPAIFLVNFFGSGGLVLPLPGLAFTAWGGFALNPPLVALVAATGETIGEVTGYMLGFSGRGLVENLPLFRCLERPVTRWLLRWGGLAVTLFAIVHNPAFDVLGIVAGGLRFPLWKFLVFVWIGKLIKALIVAYLGALGVNWILEL